MLVLTSAPMMPHLAEECWKQLGHAKPVVNTSWPKPDAALVADDAVTIAVQVNGKRRDEVRLAKGLGKEAVEALALKLDSVARALDGRPVRKVIVVPDRIINIVG
jgi:leucyl-tRNA synthetase